MSAPSFSEWLKGQRERTDDVGHFARNAFFDCLDFPAGADVGPGEVRAYLATVVAPADLFAALPAAWSAYEAERAPDPEPVPLDPDVRPATPAEEREVARIARKLTNATGEDGW